MTTTSKLTAPFPYFGGKSLVANEVWARFGNVPNYVEPFAGSCAVLLARPTEPNLETVNDADGLLSNFWRAIKYDPHAVAEWADWPVSEADLHARNRWLIGCRESLTEKLIADPDWFDARCAGWWVWGASTWIAGGWCTKEKLGYRQKPRLFGHGNGIHSKSRGDLFEIFKLLALRLRKVRVCCGDWSRVVSPGCLSVNGLTAIFLDPPYTDQANRDDRIYGVDSFTVGREVKEWAISNGNNPKLRIAVCGYEGEYEFPADWECLRWRTPGGHARGATGQTKGKLNSTRERIWFSPFCLRENFLFEM